MKNGILAEEIVPVTLPEENAVTEDEHPRPDTTLEALAALKPIVKPDGTVTAGNASGVNDGACALLIASEDAVKKFGSPRKLESSAPLPPECHRGLWAWVRSPLPAKRSRLQICKSPPMDVIELNEAFAAQGLAVLRELGIADDAAHVNANGGAIALGHPLGASGARLVTHAAYQLARGAGRYALCTMCIGVGQGIAIILERA